MKRLVFIFFFLLVSPVYSLEENSLGERSFVEGKVTVIDPEYSNYYKYPPEFGLLKNHQYALEFTAEKFTIYVDETMELKIELPDDFELIEGDLNWIGRDKNKSIKILVRPTRNGDYNITATAKNFGLNFTDKQTILIKVRDVISKPIVKSSVTDEPSTSQVVIIKDANLMANSERPRIQTAENYAHIYGIVYTYPYSIGRAYMLRGIQVELWAPSKIATVYTVEPTIDYDYGLTPRNYVSGGTWYHDDDSGSFDFGDVYVGSDGMDYHIVVRYIFHDGGDGTTSTGTEKLKVVEQLPLIPDKTVAHKFGPFHIGSAEDSGILGLESKALGDSSYVDEATHIYYDIVKTYGYFRDFVGYTHQSITAKLDPDDVSPPDCIPTNCDSINFDFWSNNYLIHESTDTIIHEYAHTIQYGMRGGTMPPLQSGDTPHGGCGNKDSAGGLIEGWARFVPTIINKDPVYEIGPPSPQKPAWDIRDNVGKNAECDRSEYTFAAILWDIVGDVGGGSNTWFDHIADTLNNHDPNLVKDFHDSFISDWNYAQGVKQVFENHNVDYYPPEITNVHTDPAPIESDKPFDILATISDFMGIASQHAVYQFGSGDIMLKDMVPVAGSPDKYTTSSSIQGPAIGTEVKYGICAQDGAGNHVCDLDKNMQFCPIYPPTIQSLQENGGSYKALAQGTDCEFTKDYSVIIGCTDTDPPPKPTINPLASPDYDGEYTVSWSAVSDTGCAGLQKYELEETSGSGLKTSYNTSQTAYLITGKDVGTYTYRVRAWDGAGNDGLWSDAASISVEIQPSRPPSVVIDDLYPASVSTTGTFNIRVLVTDPDGLSDIPRDGVVAEIPDGSGNIVKLEYHSSLGRAYGRDLPAPSTPGTHIIKVIVTDKGGLSASAAGTLLVAETPESCSPGTKFLGPGAQPKGAAFESMPSGLSLLGNVSGLEAGNGSGPMPGNADKKEVYFTHDFM